MKLPSISRTTQRNKLRRRYYDLKHWFVGRFLSYGRDRLLRGLRALGVRSGDCIMLHAAFGPAGGFRGTVDSLTDTFLEAVGSDGTLLMPSLPYHSAASEYLSNLKCFDVRRTPSRMGLVSEFFRRRPEVLRSLNPMHPVLAYGKKAAWVVAGHETSVHSCGPGTPFEKLVLLDGKVVFFNVPFATFTFFHYLEHLVSPRMPFPLYEDPPFDVPVIDHHGQPQTVRTYAFSREAIRRRRFHLLEQELWKRRLIRRRRIGNTRLLAIRVRDSIECVQDMLDRDMFFYDLSDSDCRAASGASSAKSH